MSDEPHIMQCMEIWGGNLAAQQSVRMPGLDAWVLSRPLREPTEGGRAEDPGGGDLHFVSSCSTGRITRLLVADVSGHGPGVAGAAVALRRMLGRYSNYVDQAAFVAAANSHFGDLRSESASAVPDGGFATAVVATFFEPTEELAITIAGHPRPILYSSASRTWSVVAHDAIAGDKPSNLPLGIVDDASYDAVRLSLHPGDLVLFYTDCLTESRDAAGAMLGESGLIGALAAADASRPETVIPALMARLESRHARGCFDDDATLLLIARNSVPAPASIVAGFASAVRITKRTLRSLLPGGGPAPLPQMRRDNLLGAFFRRFNR